MAPKMPTKTGRTGFPAALRSLIRYRVDNLLSRGTWAVLLWLAGVTTMVVLASSAIHGHLPGHVLRRRRSQLKPPGKACCGRSTPETMAADVGWGPRAIALIVTLSRAPPCGHPHRTDRQRR